MNVPGYAPGLYAPGHAPGLGPAAESSRGARMPVAAGRVSTAGVQDLLATALDAPTDWQAAPGCAHRLHGACARRDAWRRLSGDACAAAPARRRLHQQTREY
jgi:hypothetical protein